MTGYGKLDQPNQGQTASFMSKMNEIMSHAYETAADPAMVKLVALSNEVRLLPGTRRAAVTSGETIWSPAQL